MKILSGKMVAAVTEGFSSFLNPYIKADRATGLKKKTKTKTNRNHFQQIRWLNISMTPSPATNARE